MASGSMKGRRYTEYDSPVSTSFTKSFSANTLTETTAEQANYSVPPGYIGVFAGFSTVTSYLLMARFDAAAVGNILGTRNVSSAQNNKSCNFRSVFLKSDLVQDERNL